jgi:C1A family cysteine protease
MEQQISQPDQSQLPKKYNLKKDPFDARDFMFKAEKLGVSTVVLPPTYDLRITGCVPPVLNQGSLGSCGPNQISNALRFCLKKNKSQDFQPSRLFIYFFTRLLEGSSINEDTGISIRGGLNAIQKYGACSEDNWSYDISKFTQQPSRDAILAARTHIPGFRYIRIPQNLMNIKQAIFGGYPIILGLQLYTSFESTQVASTGVVNMPNKDTEALLGGHCVSIVGYNDNRKIFIMMNTWGNWGNKGFFTVPYDYILDPSLASDFWIITSFQ